MTRTACANCGEEASGRHGLPVNNNGDFIPNDVPTDWAAVAACEHCFNMHAAAGANADAVLTAYAKATEDLRASLAEARNALHSIRGTAERTLSVIGEYPLLG